VKGLWILGLVVVGGLVGIGVARWEAKSKSSKFSSSSPSSSPSSSSPSSSPSSSYHPSKSSSPSHPSKSSSPSQPSKSSSPSHPFVSYPASQFATVSSRPRPYAKGCPIESALCNDGTIVNTPCGCAYHNGISRIL